MERLRTSSSTTDRRWFSCAIYHTKMIFQARPSGRYSLASRIIVGYVSARWRATYSGRPKWNAEVIRFCESATGKGKQSLMSWNSQKLSRHRFRSVLMPTKGHFLSSSQLSFAQKRSHKRWLTPFRSINLRSAKNLSFADHSLIGSRERWFGCLTSYRIKSQKRTSLTTVASLNSCRRLRNSRTKLSDLRSAKVTTWRRSKIWCRKEKKKFSTTGAWC